MPSRAQYVHPAQLLVDAVDRLEAATARERLRELTRACDAARELPKEGSIPVRSAEMALACAALVAGCYPTSPEGLAACRRHVRAGLGLDPGRPRERRRRSEQLGLEPGP